MTCDGLDSKLGGLSGRPGKGGDGGAVEFRFINSYPSDDEVALLRDATDVGPGRPPQVFRERTLSYNSIKMSKGLRDGFAVVGNENDVKVGDVEKLSGARGRLDFGYTDTTQALNDIFALLTKADRQADA
jgi:hypothetical protein